MMTVSAKVFANVSAKVTSTTQHNLVKLMHKIKKIQVISICEMVLHVNEMYNNK